MAILYAEIGTRISSSDPVSRTSLELRTPRIKRIYIAQFYTGVVSQREHADIGVVPAKLIILPESHKSQQAGLEEQQLPG